MSISSGGSVLVPRRRGRLGARSPRRRLRCQPGQLLRRDQLVHLRLLEAGQERRRRPEGTPAGKQRHPRLRQIRERQRRRPELGEELLRHRGHDRRQERRQERHHVRGVREIRPRHLGVGLHLRPGRARLQELVRRLRDLDDGPHHRPEVERLVRRDAPRARGPARPRASAFPASPGADASFPPSGPVSSDSVRFARLPTLFTSSPFTRARNSGSDRSKSSGPGAQVRGVEVAQVRRVERLQRRTGADERSPRLRHLLAVEREVAVDVQLRRPLEPRDLEHRRPEERVEVDDVLADEVDGSRCPNPPPRGPSPSAPAPSPSPTSRSPRCSRSARPARRRRTCPSRPGSGSRSTARPG